MGRVREPWPIWRWPNHDTGGASLGGAGGISTLPVPQDSPPVLLVPDRERGGYKEHACKPERRRLGF